MSLEGKEGVLVGFTKDPYTLRRFEDETLEQHIKRLSTRAGHLMRRIGDMKKGLEKYAKAHHTLSNELAALELKKAGPVSDIHIERQIEYARFRVETIEKTTASMRKNVEEFELEHAQLVQATNSLKSQRRPFWKR